jgi:hypothetical protein
MNAREFFDAVVEMRRAQKRFLRFHCPENLGTKMSCEKVVDAEIQRVEDIMTRERMKNKT